MKLTKVILAKSIQDCLHCRRLFNGKTVLTGGFGQICDKKVNIFSTFLKKSPKHFILPGVSR